jgi:hypothetical protein
MPWATATKMLTEKGLETTWLGRVWLNPPFGREAVKWLRKLVEHGNGIALVPARTETAAWYECVWGVADAVCFVRGRPHFHYPTGKRAPFNSGAPIALIAYGEENAAVLSKAGLGIVV